MRKRVEIRNEVPYILMAIPALAIFITFFIWPLIYTCKYSFYNWTSYSSDITFHGLENYRKLIADKTVLVGVKNSLIYAVVNVLIQNMIALPVAVALNTKFRGRNLYRAVFFCPAVLSTLVVGYLWKFLLSASDYGFVNQCLGRLGIAPVNFLGNGDIALSAIILTQVWQSINDDLYEAASIDGAGVLKKFWHITIPGLAPAVKVNLVTGMISGLKVFDIVMSLTNGGPAHQTETILTLMFQKFSEGNYGYASSFGIAFLGISMTLACILLGAFSKWERRLGQ